MLENIYHTIRGRYKSPRTLESNSKDPLSAAKPFWSYSVWKNEEVSYAMLVLSFQHVLSRFWSCCGIAVPILKAAKPLTLEGFRRGDNAILCGRCGTSCASKRVSQRSFCVTGAIHRNTCVVFQKMTFIFRDRCSSSDVSIFISRGRRSTYRRVVLRVFLRIGMSGLCRVATTRKSSGRRGTSCEGQFASPGQYLVQNHCVWNLILQGRHSIGTLHFTFHTIRFTLYTSHFTLATFHSTFFTLHFQLYTSHFKFTFRTPHSTLYTPHSTLYTPHSALYTLHFTLRTLHCRLCTPVCTLHFALRTWNFTLHTLHSSLCTLHFTLHCTGSMLQQVPMTRSCAKSWCAYGERPTWAAPMTLTYWRILWFFLHFA